MFLCTTQERGWDFLKATLETRNSNIAHIIFMCTFAVTKNLKKWFQDASCDKFNTYCNGVLTNAKSKMSSLDLFLPSGLFIYNN